MKHIQDYKIVVAPSPQHLETLVKDLLEQDYKCTGGVIVYKGRFHQAMTLNIIS